MNSTQPKTVEPLAPTATFLGHPRGLATLFMTEFFERFSYYGMRALLVLFLVAAANGANPGLGIDRETAGSIYGLYASAVYLGSLPGGWIADRLIGQRNAVFWGGLIIALGNFLLAIPASATIFYLGLGTIVLGTGLLKPNVSALVGGLYVGASGARRDAGFSIFYMGINLGAFVAPLIAGTVGEGWNWHGGFLCAGVAMLIGVVQFKLTERFLGTTGRRPRATVVGNALEGTAPRPVNGRIAVAGVLVALLVAAIALGLIPVSVTVLAQSLGVAMVALAVFFFGYMLLVAPLSTAERRRIAVIGAFFLCYAIFEAGFEQAATTLNLFAEDLTNRSALGHWFSDGLHPASWYQSANPIFIILFAPVFAWLWVFLAKRRLDPSAPAKFALGLLFLGVSFVVMMFAAELIIADGGKVAPSWVLFTYLLQTFGELCLSPVGLSNVTKLSPPRYVGQMLGTWFLGAAIGNLAAGLIGGEIGGGDAAHMPQEFLRMAVFGGGAGILMLLGTPKLRSWIGAAAGE